MGRGKDAPHRTQSVEDRLAAVPKICIDYCYIKGQTDDSVMFDDENATSEDGLTCVVIDADTGMIESVALPNKKLSPFATQSVTNFIKGLFVHRSKLHSDGEPAIRALVDSIEGALPDRLIPSQAPTYSSSSNAHAEEAISRVQAQFRVLRVALEAMHGVKIDPRHPLWPWAIKHAGWLVSRFQRRSTGLTAWETVHGGNYSGDILPFGEACLARIPRPKTRFTRGSTIH